jgi:hypothetical protein
MKPEKYKGVYWSIEYTPNARDWYYVLSLGQSMTSVEKFYLKEISLNEAIFKFKNKKQINW